ncbi:AraC-like DNA-binding protein [Lachnotalea glycerini]|uniref:AraC family transcriptional regulator n=1 Tax=Lachnotalea glycerini TaxID=1763509 RepID=A0A255IIH7_9FIRM|nr:AraC family transcriptional regulator [Lachnotalea glycerini]PXV86267.1 AraC-like DNA-binding protein [Lachnotalea glycerini]RDY31562.1 AraC family transcriptional regulator [Lachnotalea glycerini]
MKVLSEINSDKIFFTHSVSEGLIDCHLHCHNYYEVYYFIDGDADYMVEERGYRLTPHSLLLLSPNVFHGIRVNSIKPYKRFALHFYPELLSIDRRHLLLSAFPSMGKYSGNEVFYQNCEQYRIFSFLQSLVECSTLDLKLQQTILPIYMEALLSQIMVMSLSKTAATADYSASKTITDIITYLNEHLTEPFHLDDISKHFFVSKHHLNKVFRQATGTTIYDYLLYKRIIYAQQLLIDGANATQAALNAGFKDYSSFYRAYTKFLGHSPVKDREALQLLPDYR